MDSLLLLLLRHQRRISRPAPLNARININEIAVYVYSLRLGANFARVSRENTTLQL